MANSCGCGSGPELAQELALRRSALTSPPCGKHRRILTVRIDLSACLRWSALTVVGALLAIRMVIGIDLTDEAYYTAFIDGWLKTGIDANTALSLHQTAALLIYPFALAYAKLQGGVDGIALFLRVVYLAATALTGCIFYSFVRRFRSDDIAVFAALLVASFIPFSLPAPSYNTLGMLAMTCAMSAGAQYAMDIVDSRSSCCRKWALVSAASWTVAVVSYPTLVVVQALFVAGLAYAIPKEKRQVLLAYALTCAAIHALGIAVLLASFGLAKLLAMLTFSNASLQVSSGLLAKVQRLLSPFARSPLFALLGLAMVVIGIVARHARSSTLQVCLAASVLVVMAIASTTGPVLFAKTHDLVLLAALLGAGLALNDSFAIHQKKLFRMLLCVRSIAGLVTALTATNGLVNFAVGGFFAAALALTLVLPANARGWPAPQLAVLTGVAGLFLWNAYAFVYGEVGNPLLDQPQRITQGVFRNLLTSRVQRESIAEVTRLIAEIQPAPASILVLGRLPGVYLLSTAKPMTLSTWDFGQHNEPLPKIEQIRIAFFKDPAHRADVVVEVSDPWTKPPSEVDRLTLTHYVTCRTFRLKSLDLTLHVQPGSPQARNCSWAEE